MTHKIQGSKAEAYPHRVKMSPAHAAGIRTGRDYSNPYNWAVDDSRHHWRKFKGKRAKQSPIKSDGDFRKSLKTLNNKGQP